MTIFEDLKRDEGFAPRPYQDSRGNWTIGYGFNLEANDLPEHIADQLLRIEVNDISVWLAQEFEWVADLSGTRRDALINMVFQLGRSGFKSFKKMIRALAGGDFERAADEALDSLWARQTPARAMRVAAQLRTGAD